MKHIYLCRHGESEYNAKRIVQGLIDTDLTENGINQAKKLANYLKGKNIKKLISSDLKRAFRTAQIIAEILEIKHEVDSRIREMHFGTWEGLEYEWIYKNAKQHFENWLANPVKHPLPKQESIEAFKKRLTLFFDDIKNHDEDTILVVGHGGSIQGLICLAMNLDMEYLWKFKHNNTGLSLIVSDGKVSKVRFINMSYHIENSSEGGIITL